MELMLHVSEELWYFQINAHSIAQRIFGVFEIYIMIREFHDNSIINMPQYITNLPISFHVRVFIQVEKMKTLGERMCAFDKKKLHI